MRFTTTILAALSTLSLASAEPSAAYDLFYSPNAPQLNARSLYAAVRSLPLNERELLARGIILPRALPEQRLALVTRSIIDRRAGGMKGGGGKGGKTEKGKAADKPGQKKGCHFAGDCLAMIGPFAAMGCTMAHAQISKDRKCDYNS